MVTRKYNECAEQKMFEKWFFAAEEEKKSQITNYNEL